MPAEKSVPGFGHHAGIVQSQLPRREQQLDQLLPLMNLHNLAQRCVNGLGQGLRSKDCPCLRHFGGIYLK